MARLLLLTSAAPIYVAMLRYSLAGSRINPALATRLRRSARTATFNRVRLGLPASLVPRLARHSTQRAAHVNCYSLAALFLLLAAAPALALAAPSAPAFTLKLLDGSGSFDSRALIGKKVVVVRFQASWCQVCAEEAAAIEHIYEKYRAHGVELIGVQVQDTAADARRFLTAHGARYPAGLDPHLTVANRFGFKGTPYTVVISKRGEMVERIHGRTSEARLARALDPLVRERTPRKAPSRLQ